MEDLMNGNRIRKCVVYPSLEIISNDKMKFNWNYAIEKEFKTFNPNNEIAHKYFEASKRLFNEINGLLFDQVWICYRQSTIYPIRIYFTQSQQFPISKCCAKCVFIQFLSDFSGVIKCSQCMKNIVQFVSVDKENQGPELSQVVTKKLVKSKHTEMKNYLTQPLEHSQIQNQHKKNERIVSEFRGKRQFRKQMVRRLISSQKYRQKCLKNVLGESTTGLNNKTKDIFSDKQFIIQTSRQDQLSFDNDCYSPHLAHQNNTKQIKENSHQNISVLEKEETQLRSEVRSIIRDIFS